MSETKNEINLQIQVQKLIITILATSTLFFLLTTIFFALSRQPALTRLVVGGSQGGKDYEITKADILDTIKNNYLGQYPDDKKIAENQLKGIVQSLDDPYSEYLPKEDNQKFNDDLNKRYEGVGVSFRQTNDGIIVQKVLNGSPAQQVGVQDGDLLKSVDGISTKDVPLSEVAEKIRGPRESKVKLAFERNKQLLEFEITRKNIATELISLAVKEDIAIITILSFGENLDASMQKITSEILNNQNVKKIIFDLRSNTGGVLQETIEVLSYFLENDTVVLQEKYKDKTEFVYSRSKDKNLRNYPVAVVVDKYSASASEIMAGALKDKRGAKIIGQKTFGKGVVQKLFPINGGNVLKLTIAEWLTSNGSTINKTGLEPDIKVDLGQDALEVAIKEGFN